MKILQLIFSIFILSFIVSCTQDKTSILSSKVQKDRGSLAILNTSGFMGATVAGTSIEHVLTIKSQGGLSLTNLSVTLITSDPISFKGGAYPGTGGTCGTTLDSGDTCSIIILYEPEDTDGHSANLNFSYRDSLSSYEFDYVLSADSHPILNFQYGTLYDFGNKFIGSSTDLKIKISNTGKVTAENITINNLTAPFSIKSRTCGTSLSPGTSCEITVNYSPTTNGEHNQDITLDYLNTGRPESNTLSLIAWGFSQAVLTVSDSSGHDFGSVATSAVHSKTFTITHSSGDVSATSLNVLNLSSPFGFKGGTFPGTGGTCGTTLSKETGSCTVVLALNSATSGSWNNTAIFSYYNGSSTVTINRSLSGITKIRPTLSFSTTGVNDFGVVRTNTSGIKTFTVTYDNGELPATNIAFTNFTSNFSYAGGVFPGTGGTCGTSLSSGSCTINIAYSPTSKGTSSQNIYINYFNGVSTQSSAVITLTGKTQGEMTTAINAGLFGNVVAGQTKSITITLYSTNGSPLTQIALNSMPALFSFAGGSFPGTGGTCSTSLGVSTSCNIVLSYSPITEGAHTGNLILDYNDGSGLTTHTIALSGTATASANLSMPDTSFGTIGVNSELQKSITISNSAAIQPSSIQLTSMPNGFNFRGGSFPGTGGSCGGTWTTSCTIVIVFSPTSASAYSGNLSLSYNDGTGTTKTVSANLSGTGELTNNLYISNFDTVSFSSLYVGQNRDISFTISHGGGPLPATITSKSLSTTQYSIVNDTCLTTTLSSGNNCTFTIRFAPDSSGTKNASFQLDYNNGPNQTASRLLTGGATAPALLTLTPTTFDFGAKSTDGYYEQTFTVTHSGQVIAQNLSNVTIGSGFTIVSENCPINVSVGGNCTLTARFTPTQTINYTGQLGFQYHNGYQYVQSLVNLSGSGAPTSVLTFTQTSYDFGDIIQTQTTSATLTINHSGPVPATNMNALALSAPYEFKGGTYPGTGGSCTDTLASGSCTLVIEFSPTTTGLKNQTLRINYNNGTIVREATTSLTGESLAQAIISISENNPYNMGTTNVNGSIDKTFTLSNSGDVYGTSIAGSFESAGFSFKGGSYPGSGGTCGTSIASGAACSIVITFKPTEAKAYSINFTLTYNDGLRAQTEIKGLTGTGSSTLKVGKYLSQFKYEETYSKEEFIIIGDIYQNGYEDKILLKSNLLHAVDGMNGTIFKTSYGVDKPFQEGLEIKGLKGDRNNDGIQDLLLSVHKKENNIWKLVGYIIRCARTGNIIEKYNKK